MITLPLIFKRFASLSLAVYVAIGMTVFSFSGTAKAAVNSPAPAAKISFTFDDGYTSMLTQAAPTLAKYGLSATGYVVTKCIGMTTAPNTCRANNDATYMSWAQIAALQSQYGWEIGSQSVTHPYLATFDATDGQPSPLTPDQVRQEITQSKADLAARGINATAFATPYGDYTNATLAEIAKSYSSQRGFADQNNNYWPYNDYLLNNMPVQSGVSVAQVKAKIDQAIAGKTWLVLTLHDIKTKASTNPLDYEYRTADLDAIAAYVKSKQTAGLLQPVTVSQGIISGDSNLLQNSTFDAGIGQGWTTDNPTAVKADAGNNGNYPSPLNSVKFMTPQGSNSHLFSPKVPVNPNGSYLLKSFLNVQNPGTGGIAFYMDEYDANGNWVSGQYKKAETSAFVETLNFTYSPSSESVRSASLQVIAYGGGVTAYLDNVQWLTIDPGTTPAAPVNLMANGAFDAGLSGGWRTDNVTAITADTANNGSPANPANAVKMVAGSAQAHLFSPSISVTSTKSYSLSSYLDIRSISGGEVAFYIDEYDANGNWVSGQYKTGIAAAGAKNVAFSYQPSSSAVAAASLQVILVANAGITAYLDDVRWY